MSNATVIAACGKGGVGKSAFSAGCVRALSEEKVRILAIDADPAGGLQQLLGMDRDTATMGGVRDRLIRDAKSKKRKEEIAESFDYMLMESIVETPAFDFLAMGHSRFKGCFCPVNRLLREAVESMAGNYDVVIVDAEAGLEQVYRDVMRHVDYLSLLLDCSMRSVQTAEKLVEVAGNLGMDCRMGAVINRFDEEDPYPREALSEIGMDVWGMIREDKALRKNDRQGKTIFELPASSPFLVDLEKIVRQMWSKKEEVLV